MTITIRIVVIGISVLCLPILASPTNWLYDAPRALLQLASSASASASAAAPVSYVADLTRRQEKAEKLKNGKDLTEQEDLVDATSDKEEMMGGNGGDSEGNNEASPSLLEKKVGKILTKLRLLAQIKNAYHYKPEDHEHESNITFNITSVNHNHQNATNDVQEEHNKEPAEPKLAAIRSQPENSQPVPLSTSYGISNEPVVLNSKKHADIGPLKIKLDVNEINDKLQAFNQPKPEKLQEQVPGKFGNLGVFFAEILGSIVGLTYGALAQITSGGQSPVAISTSEGL